MLPGAWLTSDNQPVSHKTPSASRRTDMPNTLTRMIFTICLISGCGHSAPPQGSAQAMLGISTYIPSMDVPSATDEVRHQVVMVEHDAQLLSCVGVDPLIMISRSLGHPELRSVVGTAKVVLFQEVSKHVQQCVHIDPHAQAIAEVACDGIRCCSFTKLAHKYNCRTQAIEWKQHQEGQDTSH